MENIDCKVCKQLIKEKKLRDIWWKIGCVVFCALSIILGILYFGSGSITKETNIEVNDSFNDCGTTSGSIIIGGEENSVNSRYQGTITEEDYTPIICITIIASMAVLLTGGVIIAYYIKRDA